MLICIKNLEKDLADAIEILKGDLNLELSESGMEVELRKGTHIKIVLENNKAVIEYGEKSQLFRALGLLAENGYSKFILEETPCFKRNGAMFDVSRNAVLKIDTLKYFLRKMAVMGLNQAMMYTEDMYEVSGEPFFGYMRGRYTREEIKELDRYADKIGIELIPCIQTLGHLERALHWESMAKYRDTENVLLVGEAETYDLIDRMLASTSSMYKSKRIHLGMDEASELGLGRYLEINGFKKGSEIIKEHLDRVNKIAKKYGLKPMIWSDMYFRLASKTHSYYDTDIEIPQNVIDNAPGDIELVYWDYYHFDREFYDYYIKIHKQFPAKTIFAGGMWTWLGPSINYDLFFKTSIPGLEECKKHGIDEVLITAWGDNGAETNLLTTILGLQVYAEFGYRGCFNLEHIKKRFAYCVGENADAFINLSLFNAIPNSNHEKNDLPNPSKFLLYQDVLLGLHDADIRGMGMAEHYKNLQNMYVRYSKESKNFSKLFEFYESLAEVLHYKSEIGINIYEAYHAKDIAALHLIYHETIPTLMEKFKCFKAIWRDVWFDTNKPYGFEVLDTRIGGLIARLETAQCRLKQYIDGQIETIEELECERLRLLRDESDGFKGVYVWGDIVSASKIN